MSDEKAPCLFCQEPIHPLATKCRYCKEFLPADWSRTLTSATTPSTAPPPTTTAQQGDRVAPKRAADAPQEERRHARVGRTQPRADGGVLRGLSWMLGISLLLFFLPIIGPFLGGLVGGKKSGSILNGILAALVPALVMANIALLMSAALVHLPVVGALLTAAAGFVALLNAAPLLVGAIIGGLLTDNMQEPVSRSGLAVVVGGSAVLIVGIVLQLSAGLQRLQQTAHSAQAGRSVHDLGPAPPPPSNASTAHPRKTKTASGDAAWCGTFLRFNEQEVPSGWDVKLVGSGPGLANRRLEARPGDSGAWLFTPRATSGPAESVALDFDAEHRSNTWGMTVNVAVETGKVFFLTAATTAVHNFGADRIAISWGSGAAPMDQPWRGFKVDTLPFTYGVHHFRVEFGREKATWTVALPDGRTVDRVSGPMPGLKPASISRVGVQVYTTSGQALWVDDLNISCR